MSKAALDGKKTELTMALLATLVSIAILVATLAYAFYLNFTKNYRKWRCMPGVPSLTPSFPFGNMGDIYMQRKSFFEGTQAVIDQLKGHRYTPAHHGFQIDSKSMV